MSRARALAVAILLAAPLSAAAQPPDLSGTWVPDPSRYQSTEELKAPQIPTVWIEHHNASITLHFLDGDGAEISALRLDSNGEEQINERAGGAQLHKSRSRWEGSSLRTEWRLERGGTVMIQGVDLWSLSGDGKSLTQISRVEDSKSKTESTIVYARSADCH